MSSPEPSTQLHFHPKSGLDKGRNGPRYQRVLALCAFFNRGNTEGTNSSKIFRLMFVYVFFCFVFWVGGWVYICVRIDFVDFGEFEV